MIDDTGLYREFVSNITTKEMSEPDYALIDQLVIKYQNDNQEAAEELIRQLSPYMVKFLKIIKLGLIDLSDRDSRRFISLFVDDKDVRVKLKKAYQPSNARKEAYQAVTMLQSACTDIPYEDIIQELIVVLLTLAKRFAKKREKVNFCGYLYNAFRFELGRRIKSIIRDPLVYRADFNLSYNDEECSGEEVNFDNMAHMHTNEPIVMIEEELENSWIRGITCGEEFSQITQLQRIILKM